MAFPTRNRFGRLAGPSANGTTWTPGALTYTTNTAIPSGQETLHVRIVSSDGNTTLSETGGNGWTKISNDTQGGAQPTQAIFIKITTTAFATSVEPAFVLGSTASEQFTIGTYAFTAAAGKSIGYILGAATSGTAANPDLTGITNNTGASQDIIAVAALTSDSTTLISAGPTGYAGGASIQAASTSGASTNMTQKSVTLANAASEDPNAFTQVAQLWVGRLLGVYEYTSLQTLTPSLFSNSQTFPTPTVTSTYALAAALYANSQSIFAPTVNSGIILDPGFDDPAYWTMGAGPSISGSKLHGNGGTAYVYRAALQAIATGEKYAYTITVSNYVAGTVQPYAGSSPAFGATISSNGTFTGQITTTSNNEGGMLLTGFDGDIDDFQFFPVPNLQPSLFTNSQSFPAPTVTRGSVTLVPSLYSDGDTFFNPSVLASKTLTPSLYSNAQSIFNPTVTKATYNLVPPLFTNSQSFPTPTLTKSYALLAPLYVNGQVFYGPTVSLVSGGTQTLTPSLFTNSQSFPTPTVTRGAVSILPPLFVNSQTFYAAQLLSTTGGGGGGGSGVRVSAFFYRK